MMPSRAPSFLVLAAGVVTVAAGELARLWAVRHIGVISRTRSDRIGPLVATGPFDRVRNPLYIGNVLVWLGYTGSAGLLWLVPVVALLLGVEYHAIVRWEKGLLEARLGDAYRAYVADVPRWNPFGRQSAVANRQAPDASRQSPVGSQQSSVDSHSADVFSWRETLFSDEDVGPDGMGDIRP